MRVALLTLTLFSLFSALPLAQAAAPVWTLDVGPGYITTTPVVDDDRVYVRTSGFWTGEQRPVVMAVSHAGEIEWRYSNPNVTQHDMAPLTLVAAGEGACGAWPDLVLVGWTDGTFEARERDSGQVLWSVNSAVDGWGITGLAAVDNDHVVVPLRQGLGRYCLANGVVDFETVTGLGWRNGVTVADDGFWVGDEGGRLWKVSRQGAAQQATMLPGSLRHAPVLVDERFLLHVQTSDASVLMVYNQSDERLAEVVNSGPSPGLPLPTAKGAIFADSSGLTSVTCEAQCIAVSSLSGRVNGEMAWSSAMKFHAPVNAPEAGWMTVSVDPTGMLVLNTPLNTTFDGYGTSAPAVHDGRLYLGNDAGVLVALDDGGRLTTTATSEPTPLLPALLLVLALTGTAILASKGELLWAWRSLSLVFLVLAVSLLPGLGASWAERWSSPSSPSSESAWDPAWPDTWLGTQVVVFALPDETLVVGGLVGHTTVLEASQAAADQLGVVLVVEETAIGTYLTSINETSASGWEYTLNGERGAFAVDEAPIRSDVVLVWRLV